MIVLLWTLIVGFHSYVFCYENLCRRPTTVLSQSSTYKINNASLANDGNLQTDYIYCAQTNINETEAWLQVDFGHFYSINNVKIRSRNEGYGSSSWKQYRFRQFYLDVSNSSASETTTTQRTRCYTDYTTVHGLPPNIIDIPCKHTARYVIVETTFDAPEDDKYGEFGPVLEVCEIEIYGCKTTCRGNLCDDSGNCTNGCKDGYGGPACDIQCHANCKNCDSKTGQFISCEKLKDSNLKILFILYGVIAALSISLIVNGYMIIWISIQDKCKGQDVKQEAMSCNSPPQDFILNQEIYEAVEDNAEYQEMGQPSGSSHYDQLQGRKT